MKVMPFQIFLPNVRHLFPIRESRVQFSHILTCDFRQYFLTKAGKVLQSRHFLLYNNFHFYSLIVLSFDATEYEQLEASFCDEKKRSLSQFEAFQLAEVRTLAPFNEGSCMVTHTCENVIKTRF
jgi:hypothetical protein